MVLKITVRPRGDFQPGPIMPTPFEQSPETAPGELAPEVIQVRGKKPSKIAPAGAPPPPEELPGTDAELEALFTPDEQRERDAEGERLHRGDNVEPALRRHADESDQLGKVNDLATSAGTDPDEMLDKIAKGGLSGNMLAEQIVAHNATYRDWASKFATGAAAVASDVGRGAIEAPRQIIGGVRDAAQAAIDGVGAVGDWLSTNVADLDALAGFPPKAGTTTVMPQLPGVKQPSTTTAGMVRGISQFLAGFIGGGKALGLAGKGGFGSAAAKGAFSDAVAFEGHEQRLSDLIERFPALRNPVTDYLGGNADEGELEGRFKRAVEGLGIGVAAQGLTLGVRAIRAARRARAEAEGAPAGTNESATRAATPMDALGDEAAPLVQHAQDIGEAAGKTPPRIAGHEFEEIGRAEAERLRGLDRGARGEDLRAAVREAANRDLFVEALPDGASKVRVWDGAEWKPVELSALTPEQRRIEETLAALQFDTEGNRAISLRAFNGQFRRTFEGAENTAGRRSPFADIPVPDQVAAQALTPKGMTPLFGEGSDAVFVNFARVKSDDDVKRLMADTLSAASEDIERARRGVRTNLTTAMASGKEDAWDLVTSRRRGEPFNAEQSVAVRRLWEASAAKLLEVADMAASVPSPENLFQFRRMLAIHSTIQQEVIAARTETARALQSWAIPVGGSKEAMRNISEMLERFGGLDVNASLASRVASLKNLPNGMAALGEIAEKGALAKSLDVVKEIWINGLLSGPKTHLVNAMSNTAVAGLQMVERFTASHLSQIAGTGEVQVGEAAAQWFGMMQGIREGWRNAGVAFKTGQSGFGIGKIELPRERSISAANFNVQRPWLANAIDALGTVVNLPGRALAASDEFSKTVGYRMELNAQAFRTASREVQDGTIPAAQIKSRIADILANPPENIRMSSVDAATYQTFTSEAGTMVKALNRMEAKYESSSPGGAIGATLLRFLVPFRNTPANIFKFMFERTPLAPLTERYRDAIARGGADADIARTRMALGTMTILASTDLAMDGHITGSGPEKNERGERDLLYRSGWQPYSVKIGDRYFAYNRMDPVGFTMGIGADLGEYLKDAEFSGKSGVEIQKAVSAAAMSIGNNALSKNYLRGISDFVTAVNGSDSQASTWTERVAGSFVPTSVSEVARAIDPYMRATGDLVSRLKARTPGLSLDLPAQRDVYGREKSYASGLGKTFDALSPIYSHQEIIQPIDREQMDQDWYLGMPAKKLAGVSLPPKVYSRFLELQGSTKASELGGKLSATYGDKTLLQALNGLVTGDSPLSTQYQKLPKGDSRKKFVGKIVSAYRKAAGAKVKAEFPKVFEEEADE